MYFISTSQDEMVLSSSRLKGSHTKAKAGEVPGEIPCSILSYLTLVPCSCCVRIYTSIEKENGTQNTSL